MSASSIELGAVFQADGDEKPIRVIAFDEDVVMYDAWWPHIQAWGMAKLTATVFYYRLPRDWFDRRMRYLRTEEYTEKERSVHRPDLPFSFALHDSMSWYSQRPDSVSQLDVQLGLAVEQESVVLGHLPAQAIYLAPFGPQGTSKPTTLISAQNERSFTELEVLWHAWQLQAPYLRERQLTKGVGLHRLGVQRTQITLPSDATITFEYPGGNTDHSLENNYVIARHVSDGSTTSDWAYARSDASSVRTVTVTYPEVDGDEHVIEHDFYIGSGLEKETRWRETASASPSQVVLTTFGAGGLPSLIETQRGSVTQTRTLTWTYAGVSVGYYLTQEDQSDWYPISGSAVPLTRKITSYNHATFPSFVTQVELNTWNGSAYVIQGKTVYEYHQYSQYPLVSTPSNVTNKSAPEFARRNPTTIRRYVDATNSVEEHFHYDDLGNVVQHEDLRGKSTYFSFADNFSASQSVTTYAFPSLVTNAEGHTTATTYHYQTGLTVTVVDARDLQTTFTYDLLNRPLTITRQNSPSNSVVSYAYDDNPEGTLSVVEETTLASGVVGKVETFVDRLSRPIQVKVYDPDGAVYADAEYDALGNARRASAPYRSGSPAWTETTYDILGWISRFERDAPDVGRNPWCVDRCRQPPHDFACAVEIKESQLEAPRCLRNKW